MQAPILEHIYSGDAWLTAGAMMMLSIGIDLSVARSGFENWKKTLRIVFIVALALAALSGIPLPWWGTGSLLALWGAYLVLGFRESRRTSAAVVATFLALGISAAVMSELRWRARAEEKPTAPIRSLIVIGDSLSSGDFGETRTWVDRLGEALEVPVMNLSRPSATTGSALIHQLPELVCEGCGVIIALGGNDVLDGHSAIEMKRNLEQLVEGARERGAVTVWMVEIPVPPGRWSWASAQRAAGEKARVLVIPKGVLAAVLTDPRATSDGLHPNDRGHDKLAREIEPFIRAARVMTEGQEEVSERRRDG